MTIKSFFGLALFSVLFFSCKNDKKNEEPETITVTNDEVVYESAPLTVEFSSEVIATAYNGYNNIKTALVNSNFSETKGFAEASLDKLQKSDLKSGYVDALAILAVEDNIDSQREAFQAVTEEMTKLAEGNITSGKLYFQFCPMAFNNKGAHWLSNEEEIRNPYFGDKMLKCGMVERDIE